MTDELPVESVYEAGIDLSDEQQQYYEAEFTMWNPTEDIAWDRPVTTNAAVQRATAEAATQFHYSNVSHLMLCGRLMDSTDDIRLKRLGVLLSQAKMRNIDGWGMYLERCGEAAGVASFTKEYLENLFDNRDTASLLTGMGVLGGSVGIGVLQHLQRAGDPLFQDIATHVLEQKRRNQQHIEPALTACIDDLDTLQPLQRDAQQYLFLARQIIWSHESLLQTLELDPEAITSTVLNHATDFYRSIGIIVDEELPAAEPP